MFVCDFTDAYDQEITVKGEKVRFDFSYRFGPLVLDVDGNTADKQPGGPRDPFWRPFEAWLERYKVERPERVAPKPTSPSDPWDKSATGKAVGGCLE